MLKISREQWAAGWCAEVLVLGAAVAVTAGVGITLSHVILLLLASLAPPAVMLLVWRGPPPQTVAEMLYDANAPAKSNQR